MTEQQQFYEALVDPHRSCPQGLTVWNGSDPTVRFAVYRNNVVASLIDALADTYPVTQALVGEEFFRAMARLFVNLAPPRSRVLAFYGESFPVFIESFPPVSSVSYLADVARLEMARVRAYHADDAIEITADVITQFLADTEALPELQIGLHPSATLLSSRYAVASLWAAHQGIAEISTVDPEVPESVLVIRHEHDVSVVRLKTGADAFIAQLFQGARLGAAAKHATEIHPDFDLAESLGLLIHQKTITSLNRSNQP
jgi:hypothetical protein